MVDNSKRTTTKIPLDYNHLSLGGTTPDAVIAAGWFNSLEREGANCFGEAEWTPKAAAHIRDGEFRYISPTILFNGADELGNDIGATLLSAAITNYPFLKGMAPVALSELQLSGIVCADLTLDERRSRVASAVQEKFGGGWDSAWYLDSTDELAYFARGAKKFQVPYSVDDKFEVTFTGEPTEVVVQYEALSVRPQETSMADTNNNQPAPFKLTEAPEFIALNQALATQSTQLAELKGTVVSLTTDLATEKTRADNAEKALKTQTATTAVNALINSGKLKAADKDEWVALHMENPDRFTKLSASLQPMVRLNVAHGSGEADAQVDANLERTETGEGAIKMFEEAVEKYIVDNGGREKVKYGDAMRAVSLAHPGMAEAYREQFARTTAVGG
jgi:hypothetical protein